MIWIVLFHWFFNLFFFPHVVSSFCLLLWPSRFVSSFVLICSTSFSNMSNFFTEKTFNSAEFACAECMLTQTSIARNWHTISSFPSWSLTIGWVRGSIVEILRQICTGCWLTLLYLVLLSPQLRQALELFHMWGFSQLTTSSESLHD